MSVRELHSEIEIDAPASRVWAALTETAAYPEWNPFIRRLDGDLRAGCRLEVRIELPGARGMTFRPTVLAAETGRELRWLGRLLVRGLFDGGAQLRARGAPRRPDAVRAEGAVQRGARGPVRP